MKKDFPIRSAGGSAECEGSGARAAGGFAPSADSASKPTSNALLIIELDSSIGGEGSRALEGDGQ